MKHNFIVLIEQGEDGAYIASVPALRSCYTQADTISDAIKKVEEVIHLCLDIEHELPPTNKFIGVQQIEITYEPA